MCRQPRRQSSHSSGEPFQAVDESLCQSHRQPPLGKTPTAIMRPNGALDNNSHPNSPLEWT